MGNIKVLDCTLRDGGYCNQWQFGSDNIKAITSGLTESGIDIIECGFLTNRVDYNPEVSKFTTIEEIAKVIPEDRKGSMYVCMVNYGEYRLEDFPPYDGTSIDGIRVAFHKKNMKEAVAFCYGLKQKGYTVFMQAMVSLSYTDEEFLNLIKLSNELNPYAFYIVDSFGVMKRKDLIRLFYVVEHNLKDGIAIGYHSHNNLQLAYSNAQALVDIRTNKDIIFDSSVFGMGRGAGNLNTELFVEYLNDTVGTSYAIKPLLTIVDEILNSFYQQNYWGYSLPNYLSAKHNAHPNYAGWLDARKTLTVDNMDDIFMLMDEEKKKEYDKAYIENLYERYLATGQVQEAHLAELEGRLNGKEVLIIAPGSSSKREKDKVITCASKDNVLSISINFDYQEYDTDYIFLSNLRRFRELDSEKRSKCIVTANIPSVGVYLQTRYKDLLNEVEAVKDNAGLMLIKFLINKNVSKIYIAGIDGYDLDVANNFVDKKMAFVTSKETFRAMNEGLVMVMREFKKQIPIEYVTTPQFIKI